MGEARRRKAPAPDDVASGLAATLTAIMRRYREHRAEQAAKHADEPLRILSGADFVGKPLPPRWMDAVNGVARDPMRVALRAEAREIGWRAYHHGGTDFMREVSGLAEDAGADPNIIDKWWDNIGGPGMSGGWWCS